MTTWLDSQPPSTIRQALRFTTGGDTRDSARFELWLELVDLHLDQLHTDRANLKWDWRSGYDDGWSPRTAAFAAWAKHLRPLNPSAQGLM